MIRQAIIFVLLFVCISNILPVNALGPRPGGWSKIKQQINLNQVGNQIQKMLVSGGARTPFRVDNIVCGCQQVVAGVNYRVLASGRINGIPANACFRMFRSLGWSPRFQLYRLKHCKGVCTCPN